MSFGHGVKVDTAIFAADPITSGEIWLNGEKTHFRSPREAIDAGIALCPEDRKEQGLVMYRSISDNIALPVVEYLKRGLFVDKSVAGDLADKAAAVETAIINAMQRCPGWDAT